MRFNSTIAWIAGAALAVGLFTAASAEQQSVWVGTGSLTGIYYPTGGAICRMVNRSRQQHGIRCATEATNGSVFNLNTVRSGELDFGVVQSDWQYHAYNGTGRFAQQGRFDGLRAVFSVHAEPFTLLARADAGIERFEDLKGKRVNIGNPGSGHRATMEVVMDVFGLSTGDFALTTELKGPAMADALCEGKIDAMIYTVGHPAAVITEATSRCDVKLIPVTGGPIDQLVRDNSYYRAAMVPGGMYKGNEEDIATFGIGATFVTSTEVSEDVVFAVVKAVFDNFEDFKTLHPAFATLDEKQMIVDGLSAPLHAGAQKYYRQRRW